eukprot:3087697-Prymnesium_polylepis.1
MEVGSAGRFGDLERRAGCSRRGPPSMESFGDGDTEARGSHESICAGAMPVRGGAHNAQGP